MPSDRPVPFTLRVAVVWRDIDDAVSSGSGDGVLFYRDRAVLTGDLESTSDGADVTVSDLGVTQ